MCFSSTIPGYQIGSTGAKINIAGAECYRARCVGTAASPTLQLLWGGSSSMALNCTDNEMVSLASPWCMPNLTNQARKKGGGHRCIQCYRILLARRFIVWDLLLSTLPSAGPDGFEV